MHGIRFGLGSDSQGGPREQGFRAARAALAQVGELPPALALLAGNVAGPATEILRGVREALPGCPLLGRVSIVASTSVAAAPGVHLLLVASPHMRAKIGAAGGHLPEDDREEREAFEGSFIGSDRSSVGAGSSEQNLFRWYHYRRPSLALAVVAGPDGERRERSRRLTSFLQERFKGGVPFLLFGPTPANGPAAIIADDRILEEGVALAMIKTDLRFSIERFHHFEPRGGKLYVTRAEGDAILELNGRPAAVAYREAIGVSAGAPPDAEEGPASFSLFPLANRGQDGRFHLLLPVEAGGGGALRFAAAPDPDQVLYPMAPVSSSEIWRGSGGKDGSGGIRAHLEDAASILVLRHAGLRDHATTFLDLAGGRRGNADLLELSCGRDVQAFLSPGDRGQEAGHLLLAFRDELDPVSVAAADNERLLEQVVRLKDLHQKIFDSIGYGIAVVDAERRVVFCNPVYRTLSGAAGDAEPGAPCHWKDQSEGFCGSCAALEAIERLTFVTREVVRMESAEPQWLRIDAFPLRDDRGAVTAAIEVLRDITAFKTLRFSLESEQRKMAAVIRGMAETLYIANRNYELLFFHPGALPMPPSQAGTEPGSRPCYAAIFGRDFPCPWCRLAEIMTTGSVKRRVARLQSGGEERAYQITFSPWSEGSGEPTAVVCLLVDISTQKRLEQQLIRSEKLNSLAILSAGMAHELNNPLGAINFNLEILKRREREPEYQEILESIRKDVLRINRIVGNLLSFSRSGASSSGWVRPTEVIDAALELFLVVLERRKVEVRKEYPEEPPVVWGNAPDLQQVLVNLISNAVDAMPAGGTIRIAVSAGGGPEGPAPPAEIAVVYDHPGNSALLRSLRDVADWHVSFFRGGDEAIDHFRRHHSSVPKVIVADYTEEGFDQLSFFLLMAKEFAPGAKVLWIAPPGEGAAGRGLALGVDAIAPMPLGAEELLRRVAELQPAGGASGGTEPPVIITFSDTGVGMPAEIQERIFDPFFTTKDNKGTGLGLSVVHKILENHEATIRVQSRPGQGTTFTLRFPPARPLPAEFTAPFGRGGATIGKGGG